MIEPQALGAQLLLHHSRLASVAPTKGELDFAQYLLRVHLVPQMLALAQHPVVLRAHQQIDRPAQRLRALHQRQNVALAVAYLHQTRVGQVHRPLGQPLVAVDPAQALVDVAALAVGILGLARPQLR